MWRYAHCAGHIVKMHQATMIMHHNSCGYESLMIIALNNAILCTYGR